IIFFILKEKAKPRLLYLVTNIFYIILLLVFIYTASQLDILNNYDLNIKASRLIRDILLIVTFIQAIFIILFTIRSIGFDIKKFEFTKDIENLEINDKDREEMELSINFDKDQFVRFYNKSKREFIYYYKENKFILFSILGLIVLTIIGVIIASTNNIITTVSEGKAITKGNISFMVEKSYITKQNYKGKVLSKNSSYLVVKFNVNNLSSDTMKLNSGYITLDNGGNIIHILESNRDSFLDIGIGYNDQSINSKDKVEYIIVFEIPDKDINKKMVLLNRLVEKKILLKPISIDKKINIDIFNIGDVVKKEYLDNTFSIDLNTLEVNDIFEYEYRLCINTICRDLTDKVIAGSRKDLIKVQGIVNSNNLLKLLTSQSDITYELDDEVVSRNKLTNINISGLINKELYLSFDEEKEEYDSMYLNIYIRNNIIKYKIK
ncbi:MAG TPA: hypothetical protein PKY25_02755, partial [Bacilli bacterium]|nr:hypothetical protein [Bacilli bacterium]